MELLHYVIEGIDLMEKSGIQETRHAPRGLHKERRK
jgi:hypothetical protein